MTSAVSVADVAGLPAFTLQLWLSPSFPVGSFAYSHGLEWAAGDGRVHDRASAQAWLSDLLDHGALRNDAILLAAAWRATSACDFDGLAAINDLAIALAGSRERRLECVAQGNAFMTTILTAWPQQAIRDARAALAKDDIAYPVAVGIAAAAHGLAVEAAANAFMAQAISNMTSALVRLAVIGQTDAQRIIAALMPAIAARAATACVSSLDDIGGAAFMSDIAAMAHETQDTRLFRS
jgi:urease accessory protein